MKRSLGIGLVFALVLTGCGGGGGGSSASSVVPSTGGGSTAQATQATITIVRPAAQSQARSAKFIPSTAQSIVVHVVSVNGASPDYTFFKDVVILLSTLNPACTMLSNGGLSCSVTVKVPQSPGVVLQISAFNSTDGTGTPVAVITTPPVDTTVANPVINASLGGVPAHILTSASVLSGAADGAKHTLTFNVWATDSSNNIILPPGNYPTPITVGTSGDSGGALTPVTTAVASPGPTLGQSTVTVTDDGSKPLTTANITLTSGSLSASVQVNQMLLSPASINIFTPGQSTAVSVSEANYSGAYTLSGNGSNFTFSCAPASCAPSSPGSAVTFLITAGANGTGTFAITDSLKGVASVPFAITGQTGGTFNLSNYKIYEYTPASPAGVRPLDITAGPDGKNVWFTDTSNSVIAAIDTTTCVTTGTPTCTIGEISNTTAVGGIIAGTDGNMYVSTGPSLTPGLPGGFTQVMTSAGNCTSSCVTNFNGTYNSASRPSEMARAANGNIYSVDTLTNASNIICCTTGSPQDQSLSIGPSNQYNFIAASRLPGPTGLFAGIDPSFAWTDDASAMIGMRYYSCSDCGASPQEFGGFTGSLFGLTYDSTGNIYVIQSSGNSIAVFNPSSCSVGPPAACTIAQTYTVPGGGAFKIVQGPDGNMWFTESGHIGILVPSTGKVYEIPIPSGSGAGARGITVGPDGNIWFTEYNSGKIGEVVL